MTVTVLRELDVATLVAGSDGYGLIRGAAILIEDGRIGAVGPEGAVTVPEDAEVVSLGGRLVTPGFVDCHTHLVFGGNRAGEFADRISGATYEEIAAAGGGIRSTVQATRSAADEELYETGLLRLDRLHQTGATTVEIKSGYGLDLATELRMLRIARRLGADHAAAVVTTLLAHVVPDEYRDDPDGYVELIVESILPAAIAAGLADAVDVFCERIAFSPEQTGRILGAARTAGLPVKIHGAQLSANSGVDVAVDHDALSVDHLEHATEAQIAAMGAAGTVAVLIPGATHTLQEARRPPVDLLERHGVPIALASDLNPGTSPVASLAAVCNLGAVLYGLAPLEALIGVTANAARALGLHDRGVIAPGRRADLAVWDLDHPDEISYWVGMNACSAVWVEGELSFDRWA